MSSLGRYIAIGVVALGALLFAYIRSTQFDFAEHARFDAKLDQLGKMDAALNQNVLKARFRLLTDYDGIPESLDGLRRTTTALATMPSFVPQAGRAPFQRKLQEFVQSLAAKEQLLEDFKSENALLNNSLRYLPLGSRHLLTNLLGDEHGRLLEVPMNRLIQQVLVHSLQSGGDEASAIAISLASLAEWRAQHPGHPQSAAVSQVAAHVRSIVSRKPKVEALTQQIIALPTGVAAEELLRLYGVELRGMLQRADIVRWSLAGACVLLLLGVGSTIYALDSVNRSLEGRVAARTAELRMQEAELRVLFDFLPAMICFKDTENRILRANKCLAESVGKSVGEIEGRPVGEIYAQEATKFYADDLEVIQSGRPKLGITESFRNEEGREFWIETDKTPVFGTDGRVIGVIAMAQDITARRRAEEEMRWKTALLEAQVNSSLDGIIVVNLHGKKILQNQRTTDLFHIPQPIADGDDDAAQLRWVTDATKNPARFVEKVLYLYSHPEEVSRDEIELKDGRVLDRYSSPVTGRDGQYYGRIWTFRDITERKLAEAALDKAHREFADISRQAGMAEVATSVLHNVGNVLNSVNVSATLVAEKVRKSKVADLGRVVALLDRHAPDLGNFLATDAQGKHVPAYLRQLYARLGAEQGTVLEEVESLRQNIEHIKEIVSMQQNYSKVSGTNEMVQITDLIEDTLRMNAESFTHHGLRVVREFAEVPPVTVEKHKVLQILVNLVRNAKQACDADPIVRDRDLHGLAAVEYAQRLAVSDNGIGIAPENLARIFNHGFTTKKDGHGFGLHSSANAAKEMGGALKVQSDGPGRGATFTLELPQT